jgi:hypothetical protein
MRTPTTEDPRIVLAREHVCRARALSAMHSDPTAHDGYDRLQSILAQWSITTSARRRLVVRDLQWLASRPLVNPSVRGFVAEALDLIAEVDDR